MQKNMGGGYVSKNKLVSTDGRPQNLLRLDNSKLDIEWIMGGNIPISSSILEWLRLMNVKMIVSLTIEKLKSGRNINHVPFDHDNTEWTDADFEQSELNDFIVEHVPIADGFFPTVENAQKLLEIVTNFRNKYPKEKVYFHCWAGRGRTCTAVIYILMKLYDLSFDEAKDVVWNSYFNQFKLSDYQEKFLKGGQMNDSELLNSQPIKKTPLDHVCYKQDKSIKESFTKSMEKSITESTEESTE